MGQEFAIEANSLGKLYTLGGGQRARVHEAIDRVVRRSLGLSRPVPKESFWAVRDCSLAIRKGETVGILGHNGAGKSVLLKMLSRVIKPTTGNAVLRGRVVSLLELGAGFNPEMTGRENIYFYGAILGVRQAQMAARLDEIVDFAGIARFIDEPTKNYSSGMYARLAFSVAAHVEADVLLIDEVLAVGDVAFRAKCVDRLQIASAHGATILFVSHSVEMVKTLCTRCLVLNSGDLVFNGSPDEAIQIYTQGRNTNGTDHPADARRLAQV
jgi:lipopolysaccharide transport system ATP-binding protein